MQRFPSIYFGHSEIQGLGVFTAAKIPSGSIVEICPLISLSAEDRSVIHQTKLHDYYFSWGENEDEAAIVLGFGSLYNHSNDPNAEFNVDLKEQVMIFSSIREITEAEEITVDYHAGLAKRNLWF